MISSLSFSQLLALYSWFPVAALLMFLLLIARFYEKFSGKRMYFQAFFVPLMLYGVAAVRYASIDGIVGDPFGDSALAAAGLTLIPLCVMIYWRMVRQRQDQR
jgi:hypothetical protein